MDYWDDDYSFEERPADTQAVTVESTGASETAQKRAEPSEVDRLVSPLFPESLTPATASQLHLIHHPSLQKGFVPFVTNIVSKFTFGVSINLRVVAMRARNCEYNPKRFNGLVMRSTQPKLTINIFTSGKAICMGAESEQAAYDGCRRAAKIVQHCIHAQWRRDRDANPQTADPPKLAFKEFTITNMLACFDCGFPIDLDNVAEEYGDLVTVGCYFLGVLFGSFFSLPKSV